jgi:secreted PhoX family phosphatase
MTASLPRRSAVRAAASSVAGAIASIRAGRSVAAGAGRLSEWVPGPYGPLRPAFDQTTGLPLVALPEGFEYRSTGWLGDPMTDGRPCRGAVDGMAVVRSRTVGRTTELTLVRNHELGTTPLAAGLIGRGSVARYDSGVSGAGYSAGGTSTLTFRDGDWVGAPAPSLGGTRLNCAGGPTPWGSWLSCEEVGTDILSTDGAKRHGYVFEVPSEGTASGRPIVGMGRFRHEAAAVDPATGIVYLTEDDPGRSGLYRYLPQSAPGPARGRPGSLERGGRLQMARVKHQPNRVLVDAPMVAIGASHDLEWVDIPDPDRNRGMAGGSGGIPAIPGCSGPFMQGWSRGCLRMNRAEGLWQHGRSLFVIDTAGSNRTGALWELHLEAMTLECRYAGQTVGGPVTPATLAGNQVDNVCVSPRGGILMCEDGQGALATAGQRLLGVLPGGDVYELLRNTCDLTDTDVAAAGKAPGNAGDRRGAELAGACFDPDGRHLFVNLYSPGITLAITGPWGRGNL